MEQSESIKNLIGAMVKLQGELQPASKNAVNPHLKNKYANLLSVWDACREPLTRNGLTVFQTMGGNAEAVEVTTTLAHTSGEWVRGTVILKPQQATPQGVGSAITYGRRYGLSAIIGLCVDEDDDGHAASHRPEPKPKPASPAPKPEPAPAAPCQPDALPISKDQGGRIKALREKLGWDRQACNVKSSELFGKPVDKLTADEADQFIADLKTIEESQR